MAHIHRKKYSTERLDEAKSLAHDSSSQTHNHIIIKDLFQTYLQIFLCQAEENLLSTSMSCTQIKTVPSLEVELLSEEFLQIIHAALERRRSSDTF